MLDGGDGRLDGDGAYVKVMRPNEGAVYCVAGCSAYIASTSPGTLDHVAMFHSTLKLGSVVIDIDGEQMDVKFLTSNGLVDDHFTVLSFPDEGLTADQVGLSLSGGGTQTLNLEAGAAFGGQIYLVAGSFSGSVVAKRKMTCGGGSSSVFSRALNAATESMCTSSMM